MGLTKQEKQDRLLWEKWGLKARERKYELVREIKSEVGSYTSDLLDELVELLTKK